MKLAISQIVPLLALLTFIALGGLAGCDDRSALGQMSMKHQPYHRPLDASDAFDNGGSARPQVLGTIPRDGLPDDTYHNPPQITLELLRRGQERFNINCAVCHGYDGYGRGMVVDRGYPQPPSLHEPRLRQAGDDYLFHVITHGTGKMQPYADQVIPADRYAIIAYIRALQRSQHTTIQDVPADNRPLLGLTEPAP